MIGEQFERGKTITSALMFFPTDVCHGVDVQEAESLFRLFVRLAHKNTTQRHTQTPPLAQGPNGGGKDLYLSVEQS